MSSLDIPVLHGATQARLDEIDTLRTAEAIAAALERLGHRAPLVHLGPDLGALGRLAATGPNLIFNLVEAVGGDATLAAEIPAELERRGLRFTGCGARATWACVSKPAMKRVMASTGLPTPAWSLTGAGLAEGTRVIVKSCTEHASLGIDARSVVAAGDACREVARRTMRHGGAFFAETYVDGREFNLSLIEGPHGPLVLPAAEIVFVGYEDDRPRIVDYEAKWVEGSHGYGNTPRRFDFPADDNILIAELSDLACRAWRRFGLAGYARVDFRVDAAGRPWILEVNTNPCLAPDAGFFAAAQRAGLDYDAVIGQIVAAGLGLAQRAA